MYIRKILLGTSLMLSSAFLGCEDDKDKGPQDTLQSGTIEIAVDETFQPTIEEQNRVFDSSFPEASLKISYIPEEQCISRFLNDSARLILVTRELSAEEKAYCEKKKMVPTTQSLAKDAIALIVHPGSRDTQFSVGQVKAILNGSFEKKFTIVFDNQGSSTFRYVKDSILDGALPQANLYAAKGSDSLIRYVANNPDAIGFIGVSSIADMEDAAELAFIKDIRVVEIYNESKDQYYKPYQAYIAPDWYPFTRNLYYIHRETYPGLGTGFANFLSRERGQLIFKHARLFPLKTNIIFREASINNSNAR